MLVRITPLMGDGRGKKDSIQPRLGRITKGYKRLLLVSFGAYVECFQKTDPHYKFEYIEQ